MASQDGELDISWSDARQGLLIRWDFSSAAKDIPSPYNDFVRIYEVIQRDKTQNDGGEISTDMELKEYPQAVHHMMTPESKGSIVIGPGQLANGVSYQGKWEDSATSTVHAVSSVFSFSAAERIDRDICALQATAVQGDEQKVEVSWSFPDVPPASISDADTLFVVPCSAGDGDSLAFSAKTSPLRKMYSYPHVAASGKTTDKVTIQVQGNSLVKDSLMALQVWYVDRSRSPYVCLGKSNIFAMMSHTADNGDTQQTESDDDAWMQSAKFNALARMQYQLHSTAATATENTLNPLLTITPAPSQWDRLMEQRSQKKSGKKTAAADEFIKGKYLKKAAKRQQKRQPEQRPDVAHKTLVAAVCKAFKGTPGFLYVGAGASIGAPACAPSWWTLMKDTLRATFDSVSDTHGETVKRLDVMDVMRQPEEIMESYWYCFQTKLFDLFKLLKSGAPNASHKAMAGLAKAGRLKAILTTNFDTFIEQALDDVGVPFKVVVTSEEFDEYLASGMEDFAVLKIHGTLDRLETIVAVANHYKNGRGFTASKAAVMNAIMKTSPTLFLGYSGYDFEHANYQAFWDTVGETGGMPVFWQKWKGDPHGGADLHRLVGQHVGPRLFIGLSALPDMLIAVLKAFDSKGATAISKEHAKVDENAVRMRMKQSNAEYIRQWVGALPKSLVLTLVLMEASHLNSEIQQRHRRNITGGQNEAQQGLDTEDTADMSKYMLYMQTVATDFAVGTISKEEYDREMCACSFDISFHYVHVPTALKQALKDILLFNLDTDPMFQFDASNDENSRKQTLATEMKTIFSSVLFAAAQSGRLSDDVTDTDKRARQIYEMAHDYVRVNMYETGLRADTDTYSRALKQGFMIHVMMLQASQEIQEEITSMIVALATKAVEQEWDDAAASEAFGKLQTTVSNIIHGTVDEVDILQSQLDFAFEALPRSESDFVEAGVAILLAEQQKNLNGNYALVRLPSYTALVSQIQTSDSREIDASKFLAIEAELDSTYPEKWGIFVSKLLPAQKAQLEAVRIQMWIRTMRTLGERARRERSKEHAGYYPKEALPAAVQKWLIARASATLPLVTDERFVQPLLGVLATLCESAEDIAALTNVVEQSLAWTGGVVTEITPVGIPEGLAALCQEQGDIPTATRWWRIALDGIATVVFRQKTDAMVLNACLCLAQTSARDALEAMFRCSPIYNPYQVGGIVGPGRNLLVQQAEEWARKLGYESLEDAHVKMQAE